MTSAQQGRVVTAYLCLLMFVMVRARVSEISLVSLSLRLCPLRYALCSQSPRASRLLSLMHKLGVATPFGS